jgi:hypothetical protein
MRQPASTWQSAPVAEASRTSMRTGTKRLLLVEDDRAIADLVK